MAKQSGEIKAKATSKSTKKAFSKGDMAVYPAHGVGCIESIESQEINGDT